MVVKNGKKGYRSFTVVGTSKTALQCKTKGKGGRLINKKPSDAAKKAFSELCRTKNIRGVCTLYLTIRDTTSGGKHRGKLYSYKIQRLKLPKPKILQEGTDNEYVIEYEPKIVKKLNDFAIKCDADKEDKPGQTRGRAKKRTAKKTRVTANNVRRMRARSAKASQAPVRRSKRLADKKRNNANNNAKLSKKANSNAKPVRRSKRLADKQKKQSNFFSLF